MICVQLSGGLGNQMFQYACGRALSIKHNCELRIDTSQLQKVRFDITNREYELEIFNINVKQAYSLDIAMFKTPMQRLVNVMSLKLGLGGMQGRHYFVENGYAYNKKIERTVPNCFLSGYWQSFKYFEDIQDIILKDFSFERLEGESMQIVNTISSANSVSIHIRRQDFVKSKAHDIHGSCSMGYYQEAIKHVVLQTPLPSFFIFSDDIEWAKENLKLPYQCNFIDGNNGSKSYVDMQLMSLCKHNIIANSSFSWWAAWLNSNKKKIVVAPKQWFSNQAMNKQTYDLIPAGWVRI